MQNPIFIAHRGYADAYPENTLIALQAAYREGARYVEIDIQLSADHVPVLFHDRDLKRLCQQQGAIHDYPFSQLLEFNVSYKEKFSEAYQENKITSLQQFVVFLQAHPDLTAFIELKEQMIEAFGEKQVLQSVLPFFSKLKSSISFISYHQKILESISRESEFSVGMVVDDWCDWEEIQAKKNWQPQWIFCAAEGLPEDNSRLNVAADIAVFEVSDKKLATVLLQRGISYLETFRIKEMLSIFRDKNINETL